MKYVLSALPAMWRASFSVMVQYRGEIALWALWGIIYPAVALAMWSAAAGGADAGGAAQPGTLRGYAYGDFAAYFLLTMVVAHFCAAWDIFEMGYLVRSGRLSPALLRPLLPMWESVANNLAYKTVTLAVLIPIWLIVAWIVAPKFSTSWLHLLLGVPAVVLAAAINYICGYAGALLAFWTTKTDAAAGLWFGGSLLFGGRMAPLALLPGPLQWFAALLPFKWVFWFPVETLTGRLPLASVFTGLLWQLGWLAAGILAFRWLWRFAIKHYAAVGA